MHLNANLMMLTIPADDVEKTAAFYEELLGIELALNLEETEAYHAPVSPDGIDLHVSQKRHPQEQTTFHFAVDDLDETVRLVEQNGGRVVWGPEEISMSDQAFFLFEEAHERIERGGPPARRRMGRSAIVLDPSGTAIGLMELEQFLHPHFNHGRHRSELADRQIQRHEASKQNARRMHGRVGPRGRGRGPR